MIFDIILWVASGLLALVYLAAGFMKATRPKETLTEMLPWAADYSVGMVKFIGIAEVVGAIGLIVPWLTGIAPILTPLAAFALVVVQILAIVVHVRRGDKLTPINFVLLALALFIGIARTVQLVS